MVQLIQNKEPRVALIAKKSGFLEGIVERFGSRRLAPGYNVLPMVPFQRVSSSQPRDSSGRVLAIDYGRRRIGLAISDELRMTARPLEMLQRKNRRDDLRRLREIVRREGVGRVIVGHPLHLDGRASEMGEEAAHFASRIAKELRVEVELVDERLTSWEAEQTVAETGARRSQRSGARGRRRSEAIDDVAAAVLLREYLNREPTADTPQREGEG
jgi:putative Holliday junction resolvase